MPSQASEYTRAILLKERRSLEARRDEILHCGSRSPEASQEFFQVTNDLIQNELALEELANPCTEKVFDILAYTEEQLFYAWCKNNSNSALKEAHEAVKKAFENFASSTKLHNR